jgi:5-methylcytosine-specific restriction endonuclease McrA
MELVSSPVDPTSLISFAVMALVAAGVYLVLRNHARKVRERARNDSRRSQLLNDLPSELRFRVYERDNFTCQRCGTSLDVQVDFLEVTPESGPIRMQHLTTRCARCAAIVRQSGIMQ